MTASFGIFFILGLLALIPFSFLGAGHDTERSYASRIQRQREAALEWTDKDILALEHHDALSRSVRDVPYCSSELQREFYGEPRSERLPRMGKLSAELTDEVITSPQFAA